MKSNAALLLVAALSVGVYAQRPRTLDPGKSDTPQQAPAPAPAPASVKAKYEGGVVGYNKKQDGTLSFDDANQRLVFRNQQQKEVLFIPYGAVSAAYPDTKSKQPQAASVVSHVPVPYGMNIPAMFVKKKYRYLTISFDDPDTNVAGTTSFKLENKEVLTSVLNTLAEKSGLTQRGTGYVKKKVTAQTTVPGP